MTLAGFPHSGTPGSQPACGSPGTIAACRALLRLSVPRHPPCALVSLGRIVPSRLRSLPSPLAPASPARAETTQPNGPFRVSSHSEVPPSLHFTYSLFPHPYCQDRKAGPRRVQVSCEPPRGVSASERFLHPYLVRWRACTRGSRKEVIQPQVPLRLPCYDFAPVTALAFGRLILVAQVSTRTSGAHSFHGVTGGVYKARERIHRGVADPRLLAIPASCPRVAEDNPN